MKAELLERLREVYGSGRVFERKVEALYGTDYANKIADVLGIVKARTPDIRCDGDAAFPQDAKHLMAFTDALGVSSQDWTFSMGNGSKLIWIEDHHSSFPIFWLSVSRVFPAYRFYYNLWKPRGETGYLDTEITEQPFSPKWAKFHSVLFDELDRAGFWHPTNEESREIVPFVFDEECHDEEGKELPEDSPVRLVQESVGGCLFPVS